MPQNWVVGLKLSKGILCLHFKYNDHESAHQEGTIDNFVSRISRGAIVEYFIIIKVFVAE